jgi:kynurenine formamidase
MRIVDLSRVMQGRMPHVQFQIHHKTPFTRVEAPAFVKRRGKRVDQISVEKFLRSAVLLDLSGKTVGKIDDEDLEEAEEAAGISVREDEVVILRTGSDGISKRRGSGFAGLSRNAVDYLLFKRIAGVGVDSSSIDELETMQAHEALLQKDVLVIENLCNLGEIDESRFRLLVLPLRMKAAGSPARVLALLDESYW